MRKNKHLSPEERFTIKSMPGQSASFKAIARALGRGCTTVSKEVRSHLTLRIPDTVSVPPAKNIIQLVGFVH